MGYSSTKINVEIARVEAYFSNLGGEKRETSDLGVTNKEVNGLKKVDYNKGGLTFQSIETVQVLAQNLGKIQKLKELPAQS